MIYDILIGAVIHEVHCAVVRHDVRHLVLATTHSVPLLGGGGSIRVHRYLHNAAIPEDKGLVGPGW